MSLFSLFRDPATSETSTLSLHDALPILGQLVVLGDLAHEARGGLPVGQLLAQEGVEDGAGGVEGLELVLNVQRRDRKSTRLNSSHVAISYAVFCLKKKK